MTHIQTIGVVNGPRALYVNLARYCASNCERRIGNEEALHLMSLTSIV